MKAINVIGEYVSILYCPRHKKTGEYLTERYECTEDIREAIGAYSLKDSKEIISTLDEPKEWEIVKKYTTMLMIK